MAATFAIVHNFFGAICTDVESALEELHADDGKHELEQECHQHDVAHRLDRLALQA